jgi:hypothetical protein
MRSDVPRERYVGRAALQARLLRLYPSAWRERYGEEFLALLQQTDVGWRQIIDVVASASREWVRAAVPHEALRGVANQGRRFVGFYAMAWTTVLWVQWMLPANAPRLSITEPAVHFKVAMLLAFVAFATHWIEAFVFHVVLRGRGPREQRYAKVLWSAMATLLPVIVVMSAIFWYIEAFGTPESRALLRTPALSMVCALSGQFGRPAAVKAAWDNRPQRPPAPPSILGLGLSA